MMSDVYRPLFVEVDIPPRRFSSWNRAALMAHIDAGERWPMPRSAFGLFTGGGPVAFRSFGITDVTVHERRDLCGHSVAFTRPCGHDAKCFVSDEIIAHPSAPDLIHRAILGADRACFCVCEVP